MPTTRTRWFNAIRHRGPGYDLPTQSEADLRTALATLAARWEQMADRAPDLGYDLFIDEPAPTTAAQVERAHTYRKAAADIREVLRAGRVPHDLMTDAELEQYGTPEATS
jgi:hypothetical protein